MDYTVEVYRKDARKRSGERLVDKLDITVSSPPAAVLLHYQTVFAGHRIELHETWVTRTNMMGGAEYQERYDTPRYCSPSSEAYWSM
jgi:hypothetical protein